MNPWLKTSSLSPRTRVMRSSSIVSSRPQVASQSGQVRMAVRVAEGIAETYAPARRGSNLSWLRGLW